MKLLLLGDLAPTPTTAQLFREKQIPTLFGDTLSLFEQTDFHICNLECALTDSEESIKKFGPAIKGPKETAEVMAQIGMDLCCLSNNHVFDFGTSGMADTFSALRENGIDYTGFGSDNEDARRNYIIEKDGKKIAVIAVCEHEYSYALENRMGSRAFDPYETLFDVRAAKETCDRVIVLYHGGKEFCEYPSPRLLKACRALVKSGADIVLCQHSHCIGCYENYEGGHILYGQGNFHFVKLPAIGPAYYDMWNRSLAVVYDTESHEVSFTPLTCTENGIRLASEDIKRAVLEGFSARNATLKDGMWQEGWHAFCENNRKNYINVIKNAAVEGATEEQNAFFAHYLDCEAHSDVWRELFPTYNRTNCVEDK